MSIPEILPYAQFFAQISLIAAAGVAGYQFVLHRRERAEQNSLQVLTRLTSPEFRVAYAKVWELPLEASADEVVGRGADMEAAVDAVMMTFEVLGVMVHNRMVPLDAVDQAIGGFLRESWRRVRHYAAWKRDAIGSRRWGEWYQWLADRLAHETRRSMGAYEAFKDWEP